MQATLFEYEQDLELLLSYLLEKAGFDLAVAQTREELVSFVEQQLPQLVVLGNCAPYVPQASLVDQIRPLLLTGQMYLLILSTSHTFTEEINSEGHPYMSCIKTPVAPGTIKDHLKQLRKHLQTTISGVNQANSANR